MNKNETPKAHYRLVARMNGDELTMESALCDEMRTKHLQSIRMMDAKKQEADKRALCLSVEYEQLGDFLAAADRMLDAARAYYEAIFCCLDGDYYDHGHAHFPSRRLRMRFSELIGKAMRFCGRDPRLKALFCEDSFIRKEYDRFQADDRF